MKFKNITTAFIVSVSLLLLAGPACSNPGTAAAKTIKWHSYDEGMALGKSQAKKVFVTFYANWCGYCKKMDKETFSDANVIDYINENFINVKVDSDKERNVSSQYRVSGLPSHAFISEKGEPLGVIPGYMDSNQFLSILKYIKTDSYKTMKLQDFINNQKQ